MQLLGGKTRILCTHRVEFVHQADVVVLMDDGKILKTGRKPASCNASRVCFIRQFLKADLWFKGTPAEILPLVEAVPKKLKNDNNVKERGSFSRSFH